MHLPLTAFIFARGGSKGVPGKNIRQLAEKPLIVYAIETALKSQYIQRVIVSTDDEAIAAVARNAGADVPFMRPKELAGDSSAEWLSWQHAIEKTRALYGQDACQIFVSTPATCPFRSVADIDRCIERLRGVPDADVVITTAAAHSNPYFTMITRDEEGYARLAASPPAPISRRQDAPKVWDIVGVVYAAKADFVMGAKGIWDGRVQTLEVPQERALDIDTEYDFLLAELLMRHKQGKAP